ncbi:MAG: hypothetical protein N3D20_01315 [Candidatus Pacearchaeota archaeon]|nr:hypothetical protein [Candidatus Pacearchaeota archaeon]
MKLPKETKRYCPYCKKHTLQSLVVAKQKGRSASHPMSRWAKSRVKKRSLLGYGNKGRFSKPAIKSWKRKTKTTRKVAILYKCSVCAKMKNMRKGIRSSRVEIGEKVAK